MYNLKHSKMNLVCFQGKPFSITAVQVYVPRTNDEETEVDWFYEDLQDLPELTPKKKKRNPFHHRGLEFKCRKSRDTWSNRQVWPWSTKAHRVLSKEHPCHSKYLFSSNQRDNSTHGHHQMINTKFRLIMFFAVKD